MEKVIEYLDGVLESLKGGVWDWPEVKGEVVTVHVVKVLKRNYLCVPGSWDVGAGCGLWELRVQ